MVAIVNLNIVSPRVRNSDQSGGIYNGIARVARDLWQHKQTLSLGFALGLDSFTAINPWPRAITITYGPFHVGVGNCYLCCHGNTNFI